MKATKGNLSKLEDLISELHYSVRYEKGNFKPGYCMVEEKNLILVNKFYDIKARITTLSEIVFNIPISPELFEQLSSHSKKLVNQLYQEQNLSIFDQTPDSNK